MNSFYGEKNGIESSFNLLRIPIQWPYLNSTFVRYYDMKWGIHMLSQEYRFVASSFAYSIV